MTSPQKIIETLEPFLSESRKNRIQEVLAQRTLSLIPVLEKISDLGNILAVMRTAESLGIGQVHFIPSTDSYQTSTRASQGSEKWLLKKEFQTSKDSVSFLKSHGFQIASTSLNATLSLEDLPCTQPLAVFFGNEKEGVSQEVLDASDFVFKIPMKGFTESFNISVAAALCLSEFSKKMKGSPFYPLTLDQETHIKALYYFKSVQNSDKILKNMLNLDHAFESTLHDFSISR